MYTRYRLPSPLLTTVCWWPLVFGTPGVVCSTALSASKANIQNKSKHPVQIPQHESHTPAPAIQQWTQTAALVTGEVTLIRQVILAMLKMDSTFVFITCFCRCDTGWSWKISQIYLLSGLQKNFLDYNRNLPGYSNCCFHMISVKGHCFITLWCLILKLYLHIIVLDFHTSLEPL